MPREDEGTQRRLSTPGRPDSRTSGSSRQSRSRARREVHGHRSRSCSARIYEHGGSVRRLQNELKQQRGRVRALEGKLTEVERQRRRDRSSHRSRGSPERRSRGHRESADRRVRRSVSLVFSTKDVMNLIKSFNQPKSTYHPPTVTHSVHNFSNINHKNILPDFDPSSKGQRIDIWLKKG